MGVKFQDGAAIVEAASTTLAGEPKSIRSRVATGFVPADVAQEGDRMGVSFQEIADAGKAVQLRNEHVMSATLEEGKLLDNQEGSPGDSNKGVRFQSEASFVEAASEFAEGTT